jgi:hypothetical protein
MQAPSKKPQVSQSNKRKPNLSRRQSLNKRKQNLSRRQSLNNKQRNPL